MGFVGELNPFESGGSEAGFQIFQIVLFLCRIVFSIFAVKIQWGQGPGAPETRSDPIQTVFSLLAYIYI